ncbi:ybbK domain protein, partial [Shigella flexneri 1235-66]
MGFKVRYDGSEKAQMTNQLQRWHKEQRLVIHCPELAAGLPIPRPPAEIVSAEGKDAVQAQARILEITGQDVTEHYQLAA